MDKSGSEAGMSGTKTKLGESPTAINLDKLGTTGKIIMSADGNY